MSGSRVPPTARLPANTRVLVGHVCLMDAANGGEPFRSSPHSLERVSGRAGR